MSSSGLVQSPLSPTSSKLLKPKGSKSSLRDAAVAASTPLSRLRNKLFAVKAFQSGSRTHVDVFEFSHTSPVSDVFDLSSPPEHDASLRVSSKGPSAPGVPPFLHKERPDLYLRQALQSSSFQRPPLPYTPQFSHIRTPTIIISKPLPPSPPHSERESGSLAMTKSSQTETVEWCSPRFILAVDPEWDPTTGEATLFIFPQDAEDLQGEADCVTLEEIWNGFFPGFELGPSLGK